MKYVIYIFSSLWRLWLLCMFLLVFIGVFPALYFYTGIVKNNKAVLNISKYWGKISLTLSGILYKVDLEVELDPKKTYIFCANHTSTIDIPLITAMLPMPICYIGKDDLSNIPLFGYLFKNNHIIVNRSSLVNSYNAFMNAGDKIDKGINICIFPEGGIPKSSVFLRKFKNGAFKLSVEKEVEIVPITLPDNKKHFPQEYYKGFPGVIRIKIHNPIKFNEANKNSIENYNISVYNIIFEQLKEYGYK